MVLKSGRKTPAKPKTNGGARQKIDAGRSEAAKADTKTRSQYPNTGQGEIVPPRALKTSKPAIQVNWKNDPANPNRMSDQDKQRMAKSLDEFGDLSGIIINRRTGLLVGGHQRMEVLDGGELDLQENKTAEQDGTVGRGYWQYGGRRYAVRVVDWPEDKAHAALLAANRFGRVGEDDQAALKALLLELDTGAMDMDLTGFEYGEIEKLLTSLPPVESPMPAMELRPYEHYDYLVVLADNTIDWEWLCEFFEIERVDGGSAKSKAKIGIGRGIRAARAIEAIKKHGGRDD